MANIKKPSANNNILGTTKVPIVGMGASVGGLEAFESFFKAMPALN
ncbi:MAG: hypothetical protein K8R67_12415 [Desulfobacteraceae bacterium]|nr:hypothetical protein [Desulfobacteraceae bacterium]